MQIAYICDKKNKRCANSLGCGNYSPDQNLCNHTLDPKHALNGITTDPKHDNRFIDAGNGFFVEDLSMWRRNEN